MLHIFVAWLLLTYRLYTMHYTFPEKCVTECLTNKYKKTKATTIVAYLRFFIVDIFKQLYKIVNHTFPYKYYTYSHAQAIKQNESLNITHPMKMLMSRRRHKVQYNVCNSTTCKRIVHVLNTMSYYCCFSKRI